VGQGTKLLGSGIVNFDPLRRAGEITQPEWGGFHTSVSTLLFLDHNLYV